MFLSFLPVLTVVVIVIVIIIVVLIAVDCQWLLDCLVTLWFLICQVTTAAFQILPSIHSVTTLVMTAIQKTHLLLLYSAEMATHGSFDPNKLNEQWPFTHFYFEANVTSVETKRAIFLTVCGPYTFHGQLLKSLVLPTTPARKKELYWTKKVPWEAFQS